MNDNIPAGLEAQCWPGVERLNWYFLRDSRGVKKHLNTCSKGHSGDNELLSAQTSVVITNRFSPTFYRRFLLQMFWVSKFFNSLFSGCTTLFLSVLLLPYVFIPYSLNMELDCSTSSTIFLSVWATDAQEGKLIESNVYSWNESWSISGTQSQWQT